MIWLLLACDPVATDSADPACADAPYVGWDNFGEEILLENCQTCHASGSTTRAGAPETVYFDTEEDVRTWKERILVVTDPETGTMPPAVPIDPEDYERLVIWLECWED